MQSPEQNVVRHNLLHSGVRQSKIRGYYTQYCFQAYESDFYFNLCYNTNYAFFDSHMNSKNLIKYYLNETPVIHFVILMQIVYNVKFIIFYDKN